MPYTAVTKPVQGEPTRKATADAIIDNQAFFNSIISGLVSLIVPNGSFELDLDSDGIPDEWDRTLYNGGSFAISGTGLADTECNHGRRAIKFTSPGGSGNGGGYIDTADFIDVSPDRLFVVSWQIKSSVNNVRNKVDVMWYDGSQVLISTTTLYTSIDNPTAWTTLRAGALPPATARYAKLRLVGAENTTTVAGDVYFDDVQLHQKDFQHEVRIPKTGSFDWVAPAAVNGIVVEVYGAGGGGKDGTASVRGVGGGGGAFARKFMAVTPGSTYAGNVGAGGAGGTGGGNGVAGGQSDFDSTIIAGGGDRGAGAGPGAGGTASGGDENIDGGAGGASGDGHGGENPITGTRATTTADPGQPGQSAGAGGSGSKADTAGSGHDGLIIIRF